LAWMYMEAGYDDEAIHHFSAALTLVPDAWLAKKGLARIYGYQKRFSEAIELMEEAHSLLPENLADFGGSLLPRIAEWKKSIGDDQGAHEAALQGYNAVPSSAIAQYTYLRALDEQKDSIGLIKVLSDLQQSSLPGSQVSYLVRLFNRYDILDEVGRAYRAQGCPKFVLAEIKQAVDHAGASRDTLTRFWLQGEVGMFQYQYNDETEDAIRLLEKALKTLANAGPKLQEENVWAQIRYGHHLARLYFDIGVSARENGTNAWLYAKRLKQLATVTTNANEDYRDFFDFYGPGYASLLWGRWLRTYERAPEDIWKKAFKARILDELNMLDDEDPSNDMAGLHSLAITLLHL
ncbi:MAG: hypothetical protein Q9180_009543, partial [Flavoplaca navasiana]